MQDYRCSCCNKLLFKGRFLGIIQIKCGKCSKIQEFRVELEKEELIIEI